MRKIEVVLTSRRKYVTAANKINLFDGKRIIGVCMKRRRVSWKKEGSCPECLFLESRRRRPVTPRWYSPQTYANVNAQEKYGYDGTG